MTEVMNEGTMASDFSLMNLNDETVTVRELKGEKVSVQCWAAWCSICLSGLDDLDKLAMSEDFKVYTIVAPGHNGEQDKDEFIEWFNGLGYENIEVLFDETGDVQKAYGVRGFPSSAYIGSDGILTKFFPGHADNSFIEESFNEIK
jgi:peroxiredoxin